MLSMAFDADSMKQLVQFYGFPVILSQEVQQAEAQIGASLIQKIQANAQARFKTNSPGGLAESFYFVSDSAFEKEVRTDKPYSWRMDQGFHGADSLGRVYDQDGTLFASDALDEIAASGEGMGILEQAAETAWARIGG